MSFNDETAIISWRRIPNLKCDVVSPNSYSPLRPFSTTVDTKFASISVAEAKIHNHFAPTASQLLKHPLAALAFIPRDAALFAAGAFAGAAAKTFTAPLDRLVLVSPWMILLLLLINDGIRKRIILAGGCDED